MKATVQSAAALLALNACTGQPPTVAPTPFPTLQAKITDQPLRVAFPGIPKRLDPALYAVIEEFQIGFALFDGLVWVDQTLTPQPMLAESWESTPDLQQWTFKVREGVIFHHRASLTARDVVYTFQRILNPKLGSTFRGSLSFIKEIEAVDEYTVRFHLHSPSAELPLLLGAPQARIVPHTLKDSTLSTRPSGTGPFRFAEYSAGVRTKVVRNLEYWQANQPVLENVEFLFLPYGQQVAALRSGTIDVMAQLSAEDAAHLSSEPGVTVLEVASGAYQNIVMRASERPFTDVRVRQALKYCVERSAMQQRVLLGKGSLANDQPIAQLSPFFADLPLRQYDPDRAKQLLTEAGYGRGLRLDLLTSTVRPGMPEMAMAFQQMAKPAGIDIRVVQTPAQVYWSDYAGKVPFHTGNWGFRPSIDETFMAAYHTRSRGNESNWRNAALDQMIDAARGEPDPAKRTELYKQAQVLLSEEGAVIIPYFRPTMMATRRSVQGFTPHPTGWLDFRTTFFGEEVAL